jgi:2-oxoisovalerate dehydrogenase E1 component alpha subunit
MIGEELIQLVTPEGERVLDAQYESTLSGEAIFGMYRDMVIIRRLDQESTSLQRQGQLALWAPVQGQEAAQIGAGRALAPGDFTFPTYREHGIAWWRSSRRHAPTLSCDLERRLGSPEVPPLRADHRPR